MFKHYIYMAPADDGDDLGGDRGDDFEGGAAPAAELNDEDLAAAGIDQDGKPAAEETTTEQPRGPDGKFAKKEDAAAIPKARFDEAVQRERDRADAAARRAAELEEQLRATARQATAVDLEAQLAEVRANWNKALVSGDDATANRLAVDADRLNRQIIAAETARPSEREQIKEELRMEVVIESLELAYPALNDKDEAFNQEITDEVLDRQRGLMEREGLAPSLALKRAAEYVMRRYEAQPNTPAPTGLGAAKPTNTGNKGEQRAQAAAGKNVNAAGRQPADMRGSGIDSDKAGQNKTLPNADDLTVEELAALPPATLARMRGDFV